MSVGSINLAIGAIIIFALGFWAGYFFGWGRGLSEWRRRYERSLRYEGLGKKEAGRE